MPDNIYLLSDVIIKIFHYLIYDQIYTTPRKQQGDICKYPKNLHTKSYQEPEKNKIAQGTCQQKIIYFLFERATHGRNVKNLPPSIPSRIKQTISCPSLWERLQTVGSKMEHTENASSSPLPTRIRTGDGKFSTQATKMSGKKKICRETINNNIMR